MKRTVLPMTLFVALAALPYSTAFSVNQLRPPTTTTTNAVVVDRRESLAGLVSAAVATLGTTAVVATTPSAAFADVWSGNDLPKGAAQFNKVIRLRKDIRKVKKRVAEGGSDIEKQEWENIGQFLRGAYSTGDDMKEIASSIKSEANKKRAMEDIEQLRKYAKAGDVSVSKQDGAGFLAVADKLEALVNDYFDALTDVPDEI